MQQIASELRQTVADALLWLRKLPERADARRPAPNKWSPREIIGHLIDSASVNHERFVRAQLQDSLVFTTYEQDRWVATQGYQDQDWNALLARWAAFNEQVASVVERISERDMTRPRIDHNLHMIAWRTISPAASATLGYFVNDYVGHLRHHLAQITAITGAGGESGTRQ
jgi:DinB family protein